MSAACHGRATIQLQLQLLLQLQQLALSSQLSALSSKLSALTSQLSALSSQRRRERDGGFSPHRASSIYIYMYIVAGPLACALTHTNLRESYGKLQVQTRGS